MRLPSISVATAICACILPPRVLGNPGSSNDNLDGRYVLPVQYSGMSNSHSPESFFPDSVVEAKPPIKKAFSRNGDGEQKRDVGGGVPAGGAGGGTGSQDKMLKERENEERAVVPCPSGTEICPQFPTACCPNDYICFQNTGPVSCCPPGRNCIMDKTDSSVTNFLSYCAFNEFLCTGGQHCCPLGTTCRITSNGLTFCDRSGGSGINNNGCRAGYSPCSNIPNGCCPTGSRCLPPSSCDVPCGAKDVPCGAKGCCKPPAKCPPQGFSFCIVPSGGGLHFSSVSLSSKFTLSTRLRSTTVTGVSETTPFIYLNAPTTTTTAKTTTAGARTPTRSVGGIGGVTVTMTVTSAGGSRAGRVDLEWIVVGRVFVLWVFVVGWL